MKQIPTSLNGEAQEKLRCKRCGNCCTMTEAITVTTADIERLAFQFHLDYHRAKGKLTRALNKKGDHRSIKHTQPCQFYDPKIPGCTIYEIRPEICRQFPFLMQISPGRNLQAFDQCPASVEVLKDD